MEDEILNRVEKSPLKTLDLEALYPQGERLLVDVSEWLDQGLVLREQQFRDQLKSYDWTRFKGAYVGLVCSTEAIIPVWAYMLISTYLNPLVKKVIIGDMNALEISIFQDILDHIDYEQYRDKPVIIKGCSRIPVPPSAYIWALRQTQKVAKSVLYGEACSAVPLYKRK